MKTMEREPIKEEIKGIKRSEFEKIKNNSELLHISKDAKFFFNEKEANEYKNSKHGTYAKHQWLLVLDDATDEEIEKRKKEVDKRIEIEKENQIEKFGKVFLNESQEELMHIYDTAMDVWSVSFVSEKTIEKLIYESTDFGTYDDEINGATPVMPIKTEKPTEMKTMEREPIKEGENIEKPKPVTDRETPETKTGNPILIETEPTGMYYPGLVVKLQNGEWYVITEIDQEDGEIIRLTGRNESTNKIRYFDVNDIKTRIGDIENDFVGIGYERHEQEVVPFILRNKSEIKGFVEPEQAKEPEMPLNNETIQKRIKGLEVVARIEKEESKRIAIEKRIKGLKVLIKNNPQNFALGGLIGNDSTIINRNHRMNGIEIKFPTTPTYELTSALKRKGFRWSGRQKLWYAKYSDSLWAWAIEEKGDQSQSSQLRKLQEITGETLNWQGAAEIEKQQEQVPQKKMSNAEILNSSPVLSRYHAFVMMGIVQFTVNNPKNITIGKIEYTWDEKKKKYAHLPQGRKRPDYYTTVGIYDKLCTQLLRAGVVIPLENIFENTHYHRKNYENLKELLRNYPQLKDAPDYQEMNDKLKAEEDEGKRILQIWNDYKVKHLTPKQRVFLRANDGIREGILGYDLNNNYSPFEPADSVRAEYPGGYIIYVGYYKLTNVYLTDPRIAGAKNVIEQFGMPEGLDENKKITPESTEKAIKEPETQTDEKETQQSESISEKPKKKEFDNVEDYKNWIEKTHNVNILELTEAQIIKYLDELTIDKLSGIGGISAFLADTKSGRIMKIAQMIIYNYTKNIDDKELTLQQYAIKHLIKSERSEAAMMSEALYVSEDSYKAAWEKIKGIDKELTPEQKAVIDSYSNKDVKQLLAIEFLKGSRDTEWALAMSYSGDHNKTKRQEIMSELTGLGKKMPITESGINAIQKKIKLVADGLIEKGKDEMKIDNNRESKFKKGDWVGHKSDSDFTKSNKDKPPMRVVNARFDKQFMSWQYSLANVFGEYDERSLEPRESIDKYNEKQTISKEAQEIIKPEFEKMKEFIEKTDEELKPYTIVGNNVVKWKDKETAEKYLKGTVLEIGYTTSYITDKYTFITLAESLPSGWYASTQRSGFGNALKPLTEDTLLHYLEQKKESEIEENYEKQSEQVYSEKDKARARAIAKIKILKMKQLKNK